MALIIFLPIYGLSWGVLKYCSQLENNEFSS